MPETLNLNYYYGNEADQYSFYRIPKILLTDRRYKGVSLEAKFNSLWTYSIQALTFSWVRRNSVKVF